MRRGPAEPDLLGVNARNLKTLEVDSGTFARIAPLARGIAPLVAESGVRSAEDVRRYRALGAALVLVGEALSGGGGSRERRRVRWRAHEDQALRGADRGGRASLRATRGATRSASSSPPRAGGGSASRRPKAIRDALPAHVPLVGVFLNAPLEEVERVARAVGLQAAQLHGAWPAARGCPCTRRCRSSREESIEPRPGPRACSSTARPGDPGRTSPGRSRPRRARSMLGELFIGGGLTAENVAQAIAAARPSGVDVASGIEGSNGFKDRDRVRAFVRAARRAAR